MKERKRGLFMKHRVVFFLYGDLYASIDITTTFLLQIKHWSGPK